LDLAVSCGETRGIVRKRGDTYVALRFKDHSGKAGHQVRALHGRTHTIGNQQGPR
jgi:hypothetical protein